MGLETGNYISALVKTNPLSSDNVSEGDDHLQLIKKILKQNFPVGTNEVGPDQAVQVLIAKSSAPTVDTSASGHAARAMGLLWLDTTNNLLKIRNQANDAWITLAVNPETSNSVDINAGTIDGAVIGGATPAAVTTTSLVATTADINAGTVDGTTVGASSASTGAFTTVTTTGALTVGADITISGDDIIMATNTDAYILVADGTSYNPVAISGDITITNAGVTSIGADKVITAKILDANVTNAKLANMAANTVKVRNANSSGVPSDLALTTTQIMIGDGTGFTAAALSGDVTMTNAGVVNVAKIQGEPVSSATVANDQYLKYSSSASEWQKVNVVGDDKLTTKGDLLVYNTVDSETRLGVGTNDYVLTANSSATNGLDWQAVAVADGAITNAKMADMAANTVKVRNANSSGVPSDLALATTQIMIGDGTGFTVAALSGDVTMANTGAVTIANDAVEQAMIGDDAVGADQLASDAVVTASIVDDAVTTDKIADDAVAAAQLASDAVVTASIADDAVTAAKLANSINTEISANTAKVTNATHTGDVTGATALTIADNAVTLAKLEDGTQGDILYYGASGAPARLGYSTSGYFLKTQGTGANPAWAEMVGGLSWQAVVTGATTMVAGRGYFVNTTGSDFSMTLPASATLGDEVHIVDYAGTFDTNNCTVARNSHNILGAGSDLVVATERAAFKLVYVDATQGWLLTEL